MAHILIVDDDEALRDVIGEAIRNLGHTVDEAEDGLDGLYKFKNNQ